MPAYRALAKNLGIAILIHLLDDWWANKAAEIVQNIVSTMGLGSQILIDVMVFLNRDMHRRSRSLDLHMFTTFRMLERNAGQSLSLLE
jgi:hypothetical protein